jgi:hypothetical protein
MGNQTGREAQQPGGGFELLHNHDEHIVGRGPAAAAALQDDHVVNIPLSAVAVVPRPENGTGFVSQRHRRISLGNGDDSSISSNSERESLLNPLVSAIDTKHVYDYKHVYEGE